MYLYDSDKFRFCLEIIFFIIFLLESFKILYEIFLQIRKLGFFQYEETNQNYVHKEKKNKKTRIIVKKGMKKCDEILMHIKHILIGFKNYLLSIWNLMDIALLVYGSISINIYFNFINNNLFSLIENINFGDKNSIKNIELNQLNQEIEEKATIFQSYYNYASIFTLFQLLKVKKIIKN